MILSCSPEPGTPEYVVAKIRTGEKPEKKEFELLGTEQVPALLQAVQDNALGVPARTAALDVLLALEWPDREKELRKLLSHNDPQVRIRVSNHFRSNANPESAQKLLEALKNEELELVQGHLARALQRIGMKPNPSAKIKDELIKMASSGSTNLRQAAATALGGWMGKDVSELLEKLALKDIAAGVRHEAARSLVMPSVRYLDDLIPRLGKLLDEGKGEVKMWAVVGILQATRKERGPFNKPCDEDQMIKVLNYIPQLERKLEHIRTTGSFKTSKMAEKMLECFLTEEERKQRQKQMNPLMQPPQMPQQRPE